MREPKMTTVESRNNSANRLAAGFALGTVLGLTPIFSLHNLFFLAIPIVLGVSVRTFLLGWLAAIPVGFLLDPLFHAMGVTLLSSAGLTPLWVWAANAPLIPLTAFNNTVTLGSLVFWAVAFVPLFLLSRRWLAGSLGGIGGASLLGLESQRHGWVRKGFVVPLALFVGVAVGAWWMLADRGARAAVERGGTRIMGATVDVGSVDVDLSDGVLAMTGLQLTDPSAPENNIVEVGEIAAAMSAGPLLRAKVAIDSVVVRDIRFNTRRETPGEVDTLRERSTIFRDEMARWRASVRIPTIPTPTLPGSIDFGTLSADSLQTVIRARELAGTVGVTREALLGRVDAVDARAQIDSASALVASLEGASIGSLGPVGATRAVSALRSTVEGIADVGPRLTELEESLAAEVSGLRQGLAALDDLRDGDYRRALGVLNLPSFDPDDISAALLQAPLMERVETLLYWAQVIDANLPDGSRSVRFEGPERLRGSGEDVTFPSAGSSLPAFAMNKLEGSVTIGAFTDFVIRVLDLSSDPAVTGRPITVRLTGESGATAAGLDLSLDRTGDVAEDRLVARFSGLPLPALDIAGLGARLDLGDGGTRVNLARSGDAIAGDVTWSATGATWQRSGPGAAGATAYLWDIVSSLTSIEITLGLDGPLTSPGISVRSNIGEQIVQALRDQIGDGVRQAEARARAEVDRLIEESLPEVRSQVSDLEQGVGGILSGYQGELDRVRTSLETRLRDLTPSLPRLPGLPG
jgi:uncharacterized protein (TIGR03545 family)/uncharacterized protein (TIGR03546 family)